MRGVTIRKSFRPLFRAVVTHHSAAVGIPMTRPPGPDPDGPSLEHTAAPSYVSGKAAARFIRRSPWR